MRAKFKEFGAMRFFHLECGTWVRICVPQNLMTVTIYENMYFAESTGPTASPESTAREYKISGNAEFSPKSHFMFIYRGLHKDLRESALNAGSISVSSL
jgi:hypothetical protein